MSSCPELTAFMSGWFHQDFDIEGETIEEIVGSFNKTSSVQQRQSLASDILNFLKLDHELIDREFVHQFTPDIDPKGFAPSTRIFFEQVLHVLQEAGIDVR